MELKQMTKKQALKYVRVFVSMDLGRMRWGMATYAHRAAQAYSLVRGCDYVVVRKGIYYAVRRGK